jgi:hypothetical protein
MSPTMRNGSREQLRLNDAGDRLTLPAPARRLGGRGRDGILSEGHELAREVIVEQGEQPPTAGRIQHLNL